LQSCAELAL